MTALKQNTSPSHGWAPRLAQESRLRRLEDLLARPRNGNEALETEIERAALLGALDRRQDAQEAFIDILRRRPTNFSALNEFGTLLTGMGAIDAARRVAKVRSRPMPLEASRTPRAPPATVSSRLSSAS